MPEDVIDEEKKSCLFRRNTSRKECEMDDEGEGEGEGEAEGEDDDDVDDILVHVRDSLHSKRN